MYMNIDREVYKKIIDILIAVGVEASAAISVADKICLVVEE